jgi:O-antigen/teichoic acid export membrane protein
MNNQYPNQSHKLNLKQLLGYLRSPFYKNSLFLISDYLVMALIGFFFWILVARFYSPVDVGYGSAAISAMSLLSMLSLIGLNFTLIRFLPGAEKPVEMINSCLTLSGLISFVLAVIFLSGLDVWSPALIFIKKNIIFSAAFVVFVPAYTFISLIHHVCLASRRADLVFILDTIQSILKIPLAVSLVLFFHSFGIAAANGIAAAAAVFLGLFLFLAKCQKNYKSRPVLNTGILGHLWHYSRDSYIASLLIAAPSWIMPIIVVNMLGSEQNAYFYVVWTISSLLNAIPSAAAQSLFIEGSQTSENLGLNIRKSLKFTYILLIPAVIIIFFLGVYFLALFGTAYSINGLALLKVLAVSSLFGGIIAIYGATLRVNNRIRELYVIYAIQTVIVLAGSFLVLPVTGTIGIGYMWLGAQAIISLYVAFKLGKYLVSRH